MKALLTNGGAKKVQQYLDKMKEKYPDLTDLINGLENLVGAIKNGEKAGMDDFAKKSKELFDKLKKKRGTKAFAIDIYDIFWLAPTASAQVIG